MFQSRRVFGQRIAELAATGRILKTFVTVRWLRKFRTRAKIEQFQQRHLAKHLAFLRDQSPYFARLLPTAPQSLDAVQLQDLPLMDKQVMMANFDDLIPRELRAAGLTRDGALEHAIAQEKDRDFAGELAGYSIGLSSGTSGHRGLFVTSKAEQERWAGTVLARALPQGKLWGHRIALFLRADNNLYERAGSKAVSFKFFDIYADMAKNLDALSTYQPTILVAPPSVLHVIAEHLTQTPAASMFLMPAKVFSVAEVLERKDAQYFAKVFGQDVIHQIYQCTEGFLAISCTHGRIHLNEDVAIFEREYLTKDRFIPIVTDFVRTSQPIVRYRLNDVLMEDKTPCPCGSALTVISRIEGREDDVLLLPAAGAAAEPAQASGNKLVRIYGDMVSRAMIYARGFTHYRVVQSDHAVLEIFLDTPTEAAAASVRAELDQLLDTQGCGPRTYIFHLYHHQVGAKLRRIERALPHA